MVTLLIYLLRAAFQLKSADIRCTSVDGFRMQAGASIDDRVRIEVHDAELLIGLITPNSMKSAYVIFELGARWGAKNPLIPLLASGTTPEHLKGPLARINALDSRDHGQVYQLLEDTGGYLGIELDKTSSYAAAVDALVQASAETEGCVAQLPVKDGPSRLSEEAMELLIEATKDQSGGIIKSSTFGGTVIQTNRRFFGEQRNPRSEAIWDKALRELFDYGFIQDPTGKGQYFKVTQEGYEFAEDPIKE